MKRITKVINIKSGDRYDVYIQLLQDAEERD